jgi:hypothetical protein
MVLNLKSKVTLRISASISLFCAVLLCASGTQAQSNDESDAGSSQAVTVTIATSDETTHELSEPVIEEKQATERKLNLIPFTAKFDALRYGKKLGYASLALSKQADNHFKFEYSSKVSFFFLSDKRYETSEFTVVDNRIKPETYKYKRTGTGADKRASVTFDRVSQKILVNNEPSFDYLDQFDNQVYRLDLQAKLAEGQTEFHYDIINDRGQLRQYQLRVIGTDQLDLPFGKIHGIKVAMVRENSTRETFAWFSPQLNYQLVRLQQFKDGEEQGDIQLSEYQQLDL